MHRDIKPKNIFLKSVNTDKKDFIIKIGDFGLVRSSLSSTTDRTMNDVFSIHYAAPEQVKDPPDRATQLLDSWAAGIVLYQMLSNTLPFNAAYPNEIRRLIQEKEPPEL